MLYSDEDHEYNIRVPNEEIRRLLVELERPWYDETVVHYLHHELELSSGEIGDLFGVTRQTIQKIVRKYDWDFHRKRGGSAAVSKDQHTLGDYRRLTLADLIEIE